MRRVHANECKMVVYVTGGAAEVSRARARQCMGCAGSEEAKRRRRRRAHARALHRARSPLLPPNARRNTYALTPSQQALAWLLGVPGASNTVLEASVPYCRGALVGVLGEVSEEKSGGLATRRGSSSATRLSCAGAATK